MSVGVGVAKAGALAIINATPFDWKRIYTHNYQMGSWDLPEEIKSGDIAGVEIDFSILGHKEVSAGEATYSFKSDTGHESELQFQARYDKGPQMFVELTNASTFGNPPSDPPVDLVYSSDTTNPFIYSGDLRASFASTHTPFNWQSQNLPSIGCQPLTRLCLPASHNAGMSVLGTHTALASEANTLCHSTDIFGQLEAGIRYFDVRPAISDGEFVTGHYSALSADSKLPIDLPGFLDPIDDALSSFQGGNGLSVADIIKQVNAFTVKNNELIILSVSHTLNTDDKYQRFTQDQLNDLLKQLGDLKHLWHAPDKVADLTTLTLNDFIKEGPAVLVVLDNAATGESMACPDDLHRKGFYTNDDFPVLNEFTDTGKINDMSADQVTKMSDFQAGQSAKNKGLFAASWTLTPDALGDIRKQSEEAHSRLAGDLWPVVSKKGKGKEGVYPNLVMVDGVGMGRGSAIKQGNLAAFCMAVNAWVNEDCRLKK
jgi:hypothetical protein